MELGKLQYRMYGLVPYNISPIQQGIQFGHAVVEYAQRFFEEKEYQRWAQMDKTFIIYNGGTTNLGWQGEGKGTLNIHLYNLILNKIQHETFHEPDLGNQLTAVVFLVDERVWDREKYPDFVSPRPNGLIGNIENQYGYKEWVESIGGEQIVWLRQFLSQFRLA